MRELRCGELGSGEVLPEVRDCVAETDDEGCAGNGGCSDGRHPCDAVSIVGCKAGATDGGSERHGEADERFAIGGECTRQAGRGVWFGKRAVVSLGEE